MTSAFERKRSPPPNYFARREQYRLLVLCSMLMLVLVMMNEARKPQTWKWMWANEANVSVEEPIETKVKEDASQPNLVSDAFRSSKAPATPLVAAQDADLFLPGIHTELLSVIEDNSILRVAENEAWQTILGVLNETPQSTLESRSLGSVSFAQLFRQSSVYRGRVVSVSGTIRRAEEITARDNENGITQLFRWIVEPAGPSNSPIVVYSLDKPGELQLGDDLREEATIVGVFFKRWAYAAGDGTRIAPLLLAKSPTWMPKPPPTQVQVPSMPITAAVLVTLGALAIGVTVFVYRSSNHEHADVKRARQYMSRGVDNLAGEEVLPSVEQSLQNLADRERSGRDHEAS